MSRDISEISLNHLLIADASSINFKNILDDYRLCFAGHRVRIHTNYNLLNSFDIVFTEKDIPHLMGWEKITSKNRNASNIINEVDQFKFTAAMAKKNSNWFKVRKRMLNYNFLHRIFLDKDVNVLVVTSDMKPNRLKLDIVFIINLEHESVVLGLRKAKNQDFFVTTTLHTERKNNQYNYRRRTKITSLEWLD